MVLTPKPLRQVFEAERILIEHGLAGTRARHHGDLVRLEPPAALMGRLLDEKLREKLAGDLAALGFVYVTVDLAGYRSGIFDQTS